MAKNPKRGGAPRSSGKVIGRISSSRSVERTPVPTNVAPISEDPLQAVADIEAIGGEIDGACKDALAEEFPLETEDSPVCEGTDDEPEVEVRDFIPKKTSFHNFRFETILIVLPGHHKDREEMLTILQKICNEEKLDIRITIDSEYNFNVAIMKFEGQNYEGRTMEQENARKLVDLFRNVEKMIV